MREVCTRISRELKLRDPIEVRYNVIMQFLEMGGFELTHFFMIHRIHNRTPWAFEAFRLIGEIMELHFGTLGLHLGTLRVHIGVLWALWGVALDPSSNLYGKGSKKVEKRSEWGARRGVF